MIKKHTRSWFDRWVWGAEEVEKFKKDKEIRHALEWVLRHPNYRALLRTFVEGDASFAHGDCESIRRALLAGISRAELGEDVAEDALPRLIPGSAGQLAMSAWLRNACRHDVGLLPETAEDVVPISCHCDPATGDTIAATYKALGTSAEDAYLLGHQLRDVAGRFKLATWADLMPFVIGIGFASCGTSFSFAEALLFPGMRSSFFYNPALGAFNVQSSRTIVIRKGAARAIESTLCAVRTDVPLPVSDVERQIDQKGWDVRRIR
jgi:hypothetical protein